MKPRQMAAFFVFCLLSSAGWLTSELLPNEVAPIAGEGFRFFLSGMVGILLSLRAWRLGVAPALGRCALVGAASLGLFCIPFLLLTAAEGKVASTSVVLVFGGMPILLAVIGASSSVESGLRLLPAGLMGIAGLMILLPLTVPRGGVGLLGSGMALLAMVCTAASLTWLHRLLQGFPVSVALGLCGLLNGIVLMTVAGVSSWSQWDLHGVAIESLRCLLLDVPETFLLLWLVRSITPQQLAVRYLVGPFLTVLEGLVLLRPRFEVRTAFGLVLLGCSAYFLLRPKGVEQDVTLKLA